jgi:2-keto-4-pentenoate hydratase/2-oxohepta-3-ene-1,7-dioic acid hydratase in catechol pathway
MPIIRFQQAGQVAWGEVRGQTIRVLDGPPWEGGRPTGRETHLDHVALLAPGAPTKIVAVGLNYHDHAKEMGLDTPDEPLLFLKPSSALIGPEADIVYPSMSSRVDYEGELAAVIGHRAKDVSADEAREHIFGYGILNDVTARDLQAKDGQWTRAKGFDTFACFGPAIVTEIDPSDLAIETFLNGKRVQASRTDQLIFNVFELVSFVSRVMTLEPGDLLSTGTPSGVGPMLPGDVVEIRIEGIGTLRNTVRRP